MAIFSFTGGVLPAGATVTRAAGPYSFTGSNGLIQFGSAANVARLDFDPVSGACRGLLLEPASTNLQLGSSVINAPNFRVFGDRSAGSSGPDGNPSSRFRRNTANTDTKIFDQYPSDYGTGDKVVRSFSVYAKNVDAGLIDLTDVGTTKGVRFTTSSGTVSSLNAGVTFLEKAANGFARLGFFAVKTNQYGYYRAFLDRTSTTALTAADFALVQLEARNTPTTYIPTTTAAATRPAETMSLNWSAQGVADGLYSVVYTFADGTMQTLQQQVSGGVSTVTPASLNSYTIRSVSILQTPPGRMITLADIAPRSATLIDAGSRGAPLIDTGSRTATIRT